jgi:hypothetical protein
MANHFEFARWRARLRALPAIAFAAALSACDATDRLTNTSEDPVPTADDPAVEGTDASFNGSFRGGIPIGTFAQPTSEFGSHFNGAMRNIWPKSLRSELAAIKKRGGKVVLMLAGNEEHFKDRRGHFDFAKWKARINRFRGVNFDDFIRDGTVIGHYLIDEPYDKHNYHGRPVPGAQLDEMARYSKQLWPQMVTIVRAEPYLIKWKGRYRHLDAAWAQYLWRKGDARDYIRRNVSEAQRMGLGLIVGLNLRHGGRPNKSWMSAEEVRSWGSALLSSSYPCAFISWQYNSRYLRSGSIRAAMAALRHQAQNRPSKSCRG